MTIGSEERGSRAEAKRDQVLGGARRVFLREGFAAASTDVIAREAGVSKRTLYAYYPSKEELFADVLRRLTVENPQTRVLESVQRHIDDPLRGQRSTSYKCLECGIKAALEKELRDREESQMIMRQRIEERDSAILDQGASNGTVIEDLGSPGADAPPPANAMAPPNADFVPLPTAFKSDFGCRIVAHF